MRLWAGAAHMEVEWTVGPIPMADGLGKEVSLRYVSNLASGESFATDANGREMLTRTRNARPTWDLDITGPIAGNFYPITAAISLEVQDKSTSTCRICS